MSRTFNRLPMDNPGKSESMAVQMLSDVVRVSLSPGEYSWGEALRDMARAQQHESSFGLSEEFARWESRFVDRGGVWHMSDDGLFELTY